ncbi:polygalacturonase-like [Aristolochia californica]|uniref:polygalacturonase-like n=1 Tax=Aristolochia californica TaxID=171875 RepID=UPI0035D8D7F5
MAKLRYFFVFLFFTFFFPLAVYGDYNVVQFGARGDGKTDSGRAFLNAWQAACSSVRPATVYVPRGSYLIKRIIFEGPCRNSRMTMKMDGTLVASTNYAAYGSGNWVLFNKVKGLIIDGGTLDGRGKGLWACKTAGRNCPQGARSLAFNGAEDVLVRGLKSINSQFFHVAVNLCKNIRFHGIQLLAPDDSPNTDGVHVQLSTGVTIVNSAMKTGDDCISIGPGTRNMWLERIVCGPGHGISIGSLAQEFKEEGVQNITVKTVVFRGTQNGVRIKSWGRPSTGFVRDVRFMNLVMINVQNPIIIDQNYCPGNRDCPGKYSGIKISGVTYKNIKGTSATPVAVMFHCSQANPCSRIGLKDVKLSYQNKRAQSSCIFADGSASGLIDPPSCL